MRGGPCQKQLLVPQERQAEVLRRAHNNVWAGHQSARLTMDQILHCFYWPSVATDTHLYCCRYAVCQRGSNRDPPCVPLCPIPLVGMPFEQIAMDFIGPLPRTSRGHRFALVVMDYATRFPEVVPLRGMQAVVVARQLVCLFPE